MIVIGNLYSGLNPASMAIITDNGISGNGSAGNPVELGVNPLIKPTELDCADNDFSIQQNNADTSFYEFLVQTGQMGIFAGDTAETIFLAGVTSADAVNVGRLNAQLKCNPAGTDYQSAFQVYGDSGDCWAEMVLGSASGGYRKFIRMTTIGGTGIEVEDQDDGIGLIGQVIFGHTGDPKQYVQFGNSPGTPRASSLQESLTASDSLFFGADPADGLYAVNASCFFRSGTGNVVVSITYVDPLGTNRTIVLPTYNLATPVNAINPYLIQVQAIGTIEIDWTVTGSVVYDKAGTIVQLLP